MLPQTPAAPSKNALRVLRQLALAGSTLGSVCAVAVLTYDTNRRVGVAQQILQNKRAFQTSAPYYDATSTARQLSRILEAAEAGRLDGFEFLHDGSQNKSRQSPEAVTTDSTGTEKTENGTESASQSSQDRSAELGRDSAVNNTLNEVKSWLKQRPIDLPTLNWPGPNGSAPTGEAGDNRRLQSQGLENVHALFERGKTIEAAEILLEKHLLKGREPDPYVRSLGITLFYSNCRDKNVFIARQLFRRLDMMDAVSPRMWEVLILALAKSGYTESAARLYLDHCDKMELSSFLEEVVLRCLLESQRLGQASRLMYRCVRNDRNCGLSGLFLSTLWKKTRSIDGLTQQFEKLMMLLPRFGKQPTEKLFNPMIRAYIQFGRFADAQALAEDMEKVYHIPLSCRTKGLLLYASALNCNWTDVENGLQEMHTLGLTSDTSNFGRIFDSIFLEYWPTHDFEDILTFFVNAVEKYNLVPDRVLFKHVVQAFVEKGGPQQIEKLLGLAIHYKWDIEFDENSFMKMLQHQRHALQHSPVGFWQMLNAARIKHGQAAFSRQILGHDQRSVPHPLVNQIPHKDSHPNWYRRIVDETPTERPIDQFMFLDKQMAQSLHTGNTNLALDAFHRAHKAGYVFKVFHVELAAIATLVEERGLAGAQKLVKDHWETRRPVVPKFFSQLEECDPSISEVEIYKMALFRFYNICWEEPSLQLKHHFMNSLVSRMLRRDEVSDALDIMLTTYQSRWARQLQFNGTCMKLLIRLFAILGNLKGVRWCILTAISRESACNDAFMAEMRRSIARLRIRIKQGFREQYLKRRLFHDHLDVLADILEKKVKGDPQLASLQTKNIRKRFDSTFQPQLHKWQDTDVESIQRIVEDWDEELEMDNLLKPPGVALGKKAKGQWDERNVVQEGDEYYVD
ncbi:uncharacterized protein TRUGW13939_08214 [Talaromyces rugulosus]|uniref:Pentatricopeptide repeat protein n=1 Tax=Talaromyces rugulosus TaxID=121627 RepID=A0A7H8R505_TALRU|nr:uncharacterized protein TRUGW13939_08214 [Talaromyces rugulosus]QKX61068.1 hypothetical protein TRUGW13939_08214 [Talaromyces rugulosus]